MVGVRLRNPLILASGFIDDDPSLLRRAWEAGFGAVTTKSLTPKPRKGYDPPVVVELGYGYLNAIGLANPGINKLPELISLMPEDSRVILSLAGSTPEDFKYSASKAQDNRIMAVELNLSCPHVKGMGMEILHDIKYTLEIIEAVKSSTDKPVFIKIGLTDHYLELVSRSLDKGVEGVTVMNTIRAMAIDIYAKKPILSNIYGGLSGNAIHPIAIRLVYDIYKEFGVPIIGVGGVSSVKDIVEFLLAGANAVGIGSYLFRNKVEKINRLIEGLRKYLEEEKIRNIKEIVGYVHRK